MLENKTYLKLHQHNIKNKRVVNKHLTHFCYLIKLVLHQDLNSHIAYSGYPSENSNHTRELYQHLPSQPLHSQCLEIFPNVSDYSDSITLESLSMDNMINIIQ